MATGLKIGSQIRGLNYHSFETFRIHVLSMVFFSYNVKNTSLFCSLAGLRKKTTCETKDEKSTNLKKMRIKLENEKELQES